MSSTRGGGFHFLKSQTYVHYSKQKVKPLNNKTFLYKQHLPEWYLVHGAYGLQAFHFSCLGVGPIFDLVFQQAVIVHKMTHLQLSLLNNNEILLMLSKISSRSRLFNVHEDLFNFLYTYTYPLSLHKNLWVETTVEGVAFCELGGAVEFPPFASVWPLIVVLTLAVAAQTCHFVPLPY